MVEGSRKAGASKNVTLSIGVSEIQRCQLKLQPISRGRLSLRQCGQIELQPHLGGCGKDIITPSFTLAACQRFKRRKLSKDVVTRMDGQYLKASHPCS